MVDVTDHAARAIGYDTFTDMGVTPEQITANSDGTMTVTFADPVDELTLTLVRERMTTRDDTEMLVQQLLATSLAELNAAVEPSPAQLKEAVLLLGALVLQRGASAEPEGTTP